MSRRRCLHVGNHFSFVFRPSDIFHDCNNMKKSHGIDPDKYMRDTLTINSFGNQTSTGKYLSVGVVFGRLKFNTVLNIQGLIDNYVLKGRMRYLFNKNCLPDSISYLYEERKRICVLFKSPFNRRKLTKKYNRRRVK